MKFFQSVTNLEELKKQYKKLAKKHHPDMGGNEKDFIALKDEYDKLFKEFNNTEELNDTFTSIINKIITFDLEIEIIGTWIWVTGNTYAVKAKLKEIGFEWRSKKKAWTWHEGEYKKFHKKELSLDEIRNLHGSKKVKSGSSTFALN